ncbi:DUF4845 domain-containing protein [Imhoffiella purpurea]|uniref:DUF4845 domain-containing protein n=1 Tax=Imhoffiella purpurea TaxID=1249627 RepID=W9VCJ5_9GAMM|nr:DUF4845 domain-containing protein [Imhoffiella purpurea]EXJ14706.1 hypothetical protein D779_2235 [Imhoffiella purpurea]
MSNSSIGVFRHSPSPRFLSRQAGLGLIGFVVLIGVIAFFVTILLKVGPTYQHFWTARTILHEVASPDQRIEGGAHGIMSSIDKRLDINMLSNPTRKDFSIRKLDGNTYGVTLEYEERVHLFFNVDAVTSFKDQVEVQAQ